MMPYPHFGFEVFMFFVLIAFLSPFFYAFAVIIESLLSNRTLKHQTTMIFYISLMNAVFLPLTLLLGTPSLPEGSVWFCYALLALIDIVYLYPYYTAMKVIDTSIVAALFSMGQITIPVMTYFVLKETLMLTQYIGFMIIIMASIALSIKGSRIPKLNRAFYYMVGASLLRAFYVVLEKYVLNLDGNWVNMVVYPNLISGFIPFSFLLVKKWRADIVKNFPPYMHKFKIFALNEFLCFLGLVCAVYGLSGLSPVISASIGATQPIFMLAISFLLLSHFGVQLKEKISRRVMMKKMFCFVLIILGVILVVN